MNDLGTDAKLEESMSDDDTLYERDFVLWLDQQAALLRAQQFALLDLPNLVEEIEAMARSDRRELRNRLMVLLAHLLKCQFQPEKKSSSWLGTIHTQRRKIGDLVDDSPSLERQLMDTASRVYRDAVKLATVETGLPQSTFPDRNPFSKVEILEQDFIP